MDTISHPNGSRQHQIIGVASMLLFLSTAAVAFRLLIRRTTGLGLWWDDYTIVFALILSWASPICNLVGLRYGLGKHAEVVGPEKITQYLKVLYTFEVLWTLTIPVIKTSILLLYNRIFPVPRVRLATSVVAFFVLTWLLWAGVSTIAQCAPVPYFWDRAIPGGHCINNDAFYIAAGAVNVFTDFAIIVIPVPIIWNLQKISLAQKVGFVAVFSLGGFVCVVSIIRLVYLGRISADDITWTDAWGGLWSSMEVSLDVVAACLPVIAPGILKLVRQGNLPWSGLRSSGARQTHESKPEGNRNVDGRHRDPGLERVGFENKVNSSWLTDSSYNREHNEATRAVALEHV